MTADLIQQVSALLRHVGDTIVLPFYGKLQPEDIQEKIDNKLVHGQDWVLVVDKQSEKFLSENLRLLLPGSLVLGEEGASASPETMECLQSGAPVWIVDPLDGTGNFKNGIPYFGILVALYQQGEILASWTYHPLTGEMLTAEKAKGSWFESEKLSVLKPGEHDLKVIFNVVLHAGLAEQWRQGCLNDFRETLISSSGIAAYDYSSLCLRQANPEMPGKTLSQNHVLFLYADKPMKPWDHAAGLLLVEEAGAYVRTLDGEKPDLAKLDRGILVAPDAELWRVAQEKILHRRPFPVM